MPYLVGRLLGISHVQGDTYAYDQLHILDGFDVHRARIGDSVSLAGLPPIPPKESPDYPSACPAVTVEASVRAYTGRGGSAGLSYTANSIQVHNQDGARAKAGASS